LKTILRIEDDLVAFQKIVLKTSTLTITNIKSKKKIAKGVEITNLKSSCYALKHCIMKNWMKA